MDANGNKPRGEKKAARPAPALETLALSDDNATAAQVGADVAQPDVASVDESHGAAVGARNEDEEEEDDHDHDDEQVERFYALLANIRAMRGLPLHNKVAFCGDTDTAGDSARKKRSAEPPWRPAFRMEDFEEPPPPPAASSCKLRKRMSSGTGHDDDHGESSGPARPPVAVVASSSMPHAAVRFQQTDSRSCSRD